MTPPRSKGFVRMPDADPGSMSGAEFEAIMPARPRRGRSGCSPMSVSMVTRRLDFRDLRSLLDCIRLVRRTVMQTAVRMITTGVMLALLAGIAIKLKIFGGGP